MSQQAHACACRVTEDHVELRGSKTLVILTSRGESRKVKSSIAVALFRSHTLQGETWVHKTRPNVTSLRLEDQVPKGLGDFTMRVCMSGSPFSKIESEGFKRWKKAAR